MQTPVRMLQAQPQRMIDVYFPLLQRFQSLYSLYRKNMSTTNTEWWKDVELLKTPSEWRKASEETTFQDRGEAWMLQHRSRPAVDSKERTPSAVPRRHYLLAYQK